MNDKLTAIMLTTKAYEMTVAVYAHSKEGMLCAIAIKTGLDSIEHDTYMNNNVFRQMKKYDTYYYARH